MYLNNNNPFWNEAIDDPMYGMEIANEATELYSKLCMNMMKVEHKAIMTENASMLSEAEENFIGRVKNLIKKVILKILSIH